MSPAPAFCEEKQRLIQAFTRAASEHLRIQSAQVAAVAHGEGTLFEAELAAAREKREAAKAALEAHQLQHGC